MPPQLTRAEKVRLARVVQEKPTLTGFELGHLLRPGKKREPQEWVVWRALKEHGFSEKKASSRRMTSPGQISKSATSRSPKTRRILIRRVWC